MTRVDLLRRQTKSTAANGCRPKGYARLSAIRSFASATPASSAGPGPARPIARNAARVTSTTGC